jgi:hypothetical protein
MSLPYLHIIIVFFCNGSLFVYLFAEQSPPFSITINYAQPPITLNNIMDAQPHTTVAPIQTTKQSATQELKQKTKVITEYQNPLQYLDPIMQTIWNYCWNKKYEITFGIIFFSIVTFYYYYYQMKQYLQDEKNWVTWHNGSLENLLESIDQSVIENLLKEIQIRYYNFTCPTDPIQALIQFGISIDQEITALKRYISVLCGAKKAYLHYLLPIESDRQEAEKKLGFIIFLRKQFLEWISRHNITSLCIKETH